MSTECNEVLIFAPSQPRYCSLNFVKLHDLQCLMMGAWVVFMCTGVRDSAGVDAPLPTGGSRLLRLPYPQQQPVLAIHSSMVFTRPHPKEAQPRLRGVLKPCHPVRCQMRIALSARALTR